MSILIDDVRIAGFRGVKKLEVTLPRIAVLIGPNNSGKTSFIKAIQIAIGDYHRFINEEDFHIDNDDKRVDKIQVDVRIIPVDKSHSRRQEFSDEWAMVFGDKIQAEPNENQFVAIRAKVAPDAQRGGFKIERFTISSWSAFDKWPEENLKEKELRRLFKGVSFLSIDAQRDLKQDIRDATSFAGKILKSLDYDEGDKKEIESQIDYLNKKTAEKSPELKKLQTHLEKLNKSFQGVGNAEITSFPKKLRDLYKFFSVHVGENSSNSFSMEYHGMGTRSWASLLTLKAFVELNADNLRNESEAFFPIIAIEEPEAHLHPNAQKTLYKQLNEIQGQVIVSSHSPYVAAVAEQRNLRSFKKSGDDISALKLSADLSDEDSRRLRREVIHSKGEILFAKALILCEGETEEQALPILFEKYFGFEAFEVGVCFVGVGGSGKKYSPFFKFGNDFDIPLFVFSDGESKTIKELEKHYVAVYGETDIHSGKYITILDGTNFEGYLLANGFQPIIEDLIKTLDGESRIVKCIQNIQNSKKSKKTSERCSECKQYLYEDVSPDYENDAVRRKALLDILKKDKTKYAPKIAEKLGELDKSNWPEKIVELFENIKKEAGL